MGSIFGYSSVEEPKYNVTKKAAEYEVREYGSQVRALVTFEGEMEKNMGKSFRALAGYIFGGNAPRGDPGKAGESIAMTAPVGVTTTPSASPAEATASTNTTGKGESIAMTAPVAVTQGSDSPSTTMTFTMPSKYTSIDQLPAPKNENVKLVEVPPHKLAVIQFSWGFNEGNCKAHEAKLRTYTARDGVKLSEKREDVSMMGYNPPWTLPWCKRNEVAIPVLE